MRAISALPPPHVTVQKRDPVYELPYTDRLLLHPGGRAPVQEARAGGGRGGGRRVAHPVALVAAGRQQPARQRNQPPPRARLGGHISARAPGWMDGGTVTGHFGIDRV